MVLVYTLSEGGKYQERREEGEELGPWGCTVAQSRSEEQARSRLSCSFHHHCAARYQQPHLGLFTAFITAFDSPRRLPSSEVIVE